MVFVCLTVNIQGHLSSFFFFLCSKERVYLQGSPERIQNKPQVHEGKGLGGIDGITNIKAGQFEAQESMGKGHWGKVIGERCMVLHRPKLCMFKRSLRVHCTCPAGGRVVLASP